MDIRGHKLPPEPESYCNWCKMPTAKDEPCVRCAQIEEARKTQNAKMTVALGGDKVFKEFTFDCFKPDNPIARKALEQVCEADPKKDNLYLYSSNAGTGKSHLTIAWVRYHAKEGELPRIVRARELFRSLRACENARKEMEYIKELAASRLLVLDDLGRYKETEFTTQTLYDVIDERANRGGGGLAISSNLTLKEWVARLGGPFVSSRLYSMCKIVSLEGERDRRIRP